MVESKGKNQVPKFTLTPSTDLSCFSPEKSMLKKKLTNLSQSKNEFMLISYWNLNEYYYYEI